jgi:hypothetical protein
MGSRSLQPAFPITPSFLLAMIPGIWNDDQRFDELTGELTHCGSEALCNWLGLADGDVLRPADADESDLYYGDVELVFDHPDGSTTTFLVSMELDGDMSE